jgi:hypothetical protein
LILRKYFFWRKKFGRRNAGTTEGGNDRTREQLEWYYLGPIQKPGYSPTAKKKDVWHPFDLGPTPQNFSLLKQIASQPFERLPGCNMPPALLQLERQRELREEVFVAERDGDGGAIRDRATPKRAAIQWVPSKPVLKAEGE